jgi:hypothetical protein
VRISITSGWPTRHPEPQSWDSVPGLFLVLFLTKIVGLFPRFSCANICKQRGIYSKSTPSSENGAFRKGASEMNRRSFIVDASQALAFSLVARKAHADASSEQQASQLCFKPLTLKATIAPGQPRTRRQQNGWPTKCGN